MWLWEAVGRDLGSMGGEKASGKGEVGGRGTTKGEGKADLAQVPRGAGNARKKKGNFGAGAGAVGRVKKGGDRGLEVGTRLGRRHVEPRAGKLLSGSATFL